nr:hypothetical protein [Bacilli bacterium]
MKKRNLGYLVTATVGITLLSGCNLVSTPKAIQTQVATQTVDPTGLQAVLASIDTMKGLSSFEVKAQIQEAAGKFNRQVDYYGSILLPHTVYVDETIGGNDYLVYQDGTFSYYRDNGHWYPMQPLTALKPWDSLRKLLTTNPPKVVDQLPTQTVVSWLCNVYQFTTSASPVIGGSSLTSTLGKTPSKALYTVWVDATDGKLRQIEVQSTIGVPEIGTASISSTELIFGENAINSLPVPQDLVSQVEKP